MLLYELATVGMVFFYRSESLEYNIMSKLLKGDRFYQCSEITIFLKLKKLQGGEGEYVRITRSINHGRTVK